MQRCLHTGEQLTAPICATDFSMSILHGGRWDDVKWIDWKPRGPPARRGEIAERRLERGKRLLVPLPLPLEQG